jgi:hypothetical protein
MDTLVKAIEGGSLNAWINASAWLWPLLEIVHFIGLTLLLGSLLIIDLHLAGWVRKTDVTAVHALVPWSILGFLMNLLSGALFLIGDPARYWENTAFRLKMGLIVIAGLNAIWFFRWVRPLMERRYKHGDSPASAKTAAIVSLFGWLGVLLLGRLIPYVGSG